MQAYTKASEERIKLLASTLANAAVGSFITGVIAPIIAAAVNGTKSTDTYSVIGFVMAIAVVLTAVLAFWSSVVLGSLEADEGSDQ
jgi:Na+/melibiose symporter-like transporter